MTQIYFIRHSIPDLSTKDEMRPLSEEGLKKAFDLIKIFEKLHIDMIFSSPYKRAIQTLEPIAINKNIDINIVDDFRERKVSDDWVDKFMEYSKKQWKDFMYKLENGESLSEVQFRNIKSLEKILEENKGKTIIIGTHGTALSTIINFYDNTFNFDNFVEIMDIMPYIIKFEFGNNNEYIKRIDDIIE